MSAHSHVQRMHFLQQQQQAERQHRASLPSHMSGGGGAPSGPPSMISGYAPRSTAGSASGPGYTAYHPHPGRPGLYTSQSQGSLSSQPVSVSTFGGPPRGSVGGTARMYHQSNLKASRSLGASRASLATNKSGKSTIQQEHRDRRVRQEMFSPWFGKARQPFILAIVMFTIALVLLAVGATFIGLTAHGRLFIPVDNATVIGPIIMVIGVLAAFVGIKFVYSAYKINAMERGRLKLRAHNASMISINTVGSRKDEHDGENLVSGGATKNAVTRTPTGSRMSLSNIP